MLTRYSRCFLLLIIGAIFPITVATGGQEIPSSPNTSSYFRQRLTRDSLLPCKYLEENTQGLEQIEWWYRGVGIQFIGTFDPRTRMAATNWTRDGAYQVTEPNGTLSIKNARRELVERYDCVAHFPADQHRSPLVHAVYFRLDFSFWYAAQPDSLFFGSCLAAVVFCAASFLLNIIWIICRHAILWWIRRTERLSRVRALILAMEKYRQKQMESLHETYNRRVSAIRDNYHSQMDQLRQSYADSADRFRDYRQAQMDHVHQHLDSIRDNYSQQIHRMREFGSRRVEQIWDGYDRSITALRTFTLEQRMRILNQYKVKQRYVNKLLEAIAAETNAEVISKKEAAIREVLGEKEEELLAWLPAPHRVTVEMEERGIGIGERGNSAASIARSASYYSLPEYLIEEEEEDERGQIKIMLEEKEGRPEELDRRFRDEQGEEEEDEKAMQPSTSTAPICLTTTTQRVRFSGLPNRNEEN